VVGGWWLVVDTKVEEWSEESALRDEMGRRTKNRLYRELATWGGRLSLTPATKSSEKSPHLQSSPAATGTRHHTRTVKHLKTAHSSSNNNNSNNNINRNMSTEEESKVSAEEDVTMTEEDPQEEPQEVR